MPAKLSRRVLSTLPHHAIHTARNWSKADVALIEWPPSSGTKVVVKDLRGRPLWFRVFAGRFLLWREWRALRALENVAGVPRAIARPDADCLVMEFKAGRRLDSFRSGNVPHDVVERINTLLSEVHRRGVTHGDLHSHNILLDENDEVALIDWATACVFPARRIGPKAVSFQEWKALDERALAKVKVACAPLDVTPRERELLLRGGSRVYRAIKKFKSWKEQVRGVDEATKTRRERARRRTLRRLNKYPQDISEQQRAQMRDELEERKTLLRENAGSSTKTSG